LAGASEQNIEDVKTIGELILQMSKFFHQINYDFGRFKEEVTKAHQFIGKKMGG
jgi:hypothetical protein